MLNQPKNRCLNHNKQIILMSPECPLDVIWMLFGCIFSVFKHLRANTSQLLRNVTSVTSCNLASGNIFSTPKYLFLLGFIAPILYIYIVLPKNNIYIYISTYVFYRNSLFLICFYIFSLLVANGGNRFAYSKWGV